MEAVRVGEVEKSHNTIVYFSLEMQNKQDIMVLSKLKHSICPCLTGK
jgi:hypothetical protein